MIKISDGTGTGKTAKVTEDNEVSTLSNVRGIASKAALNGDTFVFPTDFITYTGLSTALTTEHGVLYIQNSAADKFHIETLRVSNSNPVYIRVRKDPTSRTSFASAASQNMDLTGGKTFRGTFEVGQNNSNAVGAVLMAQQRVDTVGRFDLDGTLILEAGDAIVVTVELSATATTRLGSTVIGYYHFD